MDILPHGKGHWSHNHWDLFQACECSAGGAGNRKHSCSEIWKSCDCYVSSSNLLSVPVLPGIQADDTKAFVFTEAKISVLNTTPFSTVCGGHFCDKQRCEEISNLGAKCGCYNMNSMWGNMTFGHNIKVKVPQLSFVHKNFSSANCTSRVIYQVLWRLKSFQGTDAEIVLGTKVSATVNYINSKGGWTEIGWYRRGTIMDRVLMTPSESNQPGEILQVVIFHIALWDFCLPKQLMQFIHQGNWMLQLSVSTVLSNF